MSVPGIPAIDQRLVDEYDTAHERMASSVRAADPAAQLVFTVVQRRLMVESLAYVQSVLVRPVGQLAVPPPRTFLTRAQQLRVRGATAAFRHIDTRITLEQQGLVATAVDPSTPQALHALFEGANPGDHETNPGMLRATSTSWQKDINPFTHPPAAECPALLAEAMDIMEDRSVAGAVRAGWFMFTFLTIHPFVDGNGRTSRGLYLTVASPSLSLGLDWGIVEQWSVSRSEYIATLQAGNHVTQYDTKVMTAEPFTRYSIAASIAGVDVCTQRLMMLGRAYGEHRDAGLSTDAAIVATVIAADRCCTWEELLPTGLSAARLDAAVAELLDRGAVGWAPRPHGRRTIDDPAEYALFPATVAG